MRWACSAVLAPWLVLAPSVARSAEAVEGGPDAPIAEEPRVRPTLAWGLTQLLPSPEIIAGQGGARFGLRWQVTPLLYSWGINRKLNPWRGLVVEPNVRHSGSIELFLSPEFVARTADLGGDFWDKWLVRPGLRAYFPLVERGDYLSMSVGTSFARFAHRSSIAYEGGIYALFGLFGLQVTYSPLPHDPLELITTFRIRYF